MVRRDKVRSNLNVLRGVLGSLNEYRAATSWETFNDDDKVRNLIEYALLRALTLGLDIVKEWAPPRTHGGAPRYDDGLWPMQEDNVLDEFLAARLAESIQLRNDLAHCSSALSRERVFAACETSDWIALFADHIERYLASTIYRCLR